MTTTTLFLALALSATSAPAAHDDEGRAHDVVRADADARDDDARDDDARDAPATTRAHDDTTAVARRLCVTDEDRRVAEAARRREAFSTTTVPLGPLYWASADRTLTQAMLVWWRVLDLEEGARLTLVLPLFAESCTPTRTTTVGPLGLLAWREDDAGEAGYIGPYFFRRDARETTDALLPLYFSSRMHDDAGETRTLFVLGPAYRLSTRADQLMGVMPLYARYRGRDGRFADLLLPLAFRFGDDDEETFLVGNTLAHRTRDDAFVHALFLFHASGTKDGKDGTLSIPLLATHLSHETRDGVTSRLRLVGPTYFSDDGRGTVAFASPLYARYRAPGGRFADVLFPLALRFGDEDEQTFLVGNTLGHVTRDDAFVHALFLFHASGTRDGENGTLSIPLLATHLSHETRDGVTSRLRLVGPTYFSDDGRGTVRFVSPVYARMRTADGFALDAVPPLLAGRVVVDDDTFATGVFPFYDVSLDGARGRGVFMLLHDGALPDAVSDLAPAPLAPLVAPGTHARVVPPLLFARLENARARAALLGPAYRVEGELGAHTGLLPLFATGTSSSGDARYTVVPPLAFAHFADGDARATVAGPIYRFSTTESDALGVVGLFASRRAPGDHAFIAPGFARFSDAPTLGDGTSETIVVLQTVSERTPEGRRILSPPFYFAAHDDVTGDFVRVAPPLLAAEWREAGVRRRVMPLYVDVEDASGTDQLFFPFVLMGHAKPGHSTTPLLSLLEREALAPVVGDEDARRVMRGDGRAYVVAPLLLTGHLRDGDVSATLVGQTYVVTGEDDALHVGSAPFYFGGRTSRGSYHLVPPLLSALVVDEEGSVAVAFAAYRLEGEGRVDQGVAPLFFTGHADDGSGYTVAPPLALVHQRDAHGAKLVAGNFFFIDDDRLGRHHGLLPLYLSSSFGASRFLVAPGVLRFGTGDDDTFVALQTVAMKRGAAHGTFASFPFYLRHRDAETALDVMPAALSLDFVDDAGDRVRLRGPAFDVASPMGRVAGLAPLFVSLEGEDARALATPFFVDARHDGARLTLLPGLARRARLDHTTLLVGQTLVTRSSTAWGVSSAPFYFGGVDLAAKRQAHVVPLALTAMWGDTKDVDGATSNLVVGPLYRSESTRGAELAVAPFVFTGRGARTPLRPFIVESMERALGPGIASPLEHGDAAYTLVPLAGFAHLATDDGLRTTTVALQTVHHQSPDRWLLHSAPFYFGEETREGSAHVVPLLLSGTGEDVTQGKETTVVAPLAYARTRDAHHETTLLGPYFAHDDDQGHRMRALAPLFVDIENEHGFMKMLTPLLFTWGDDDARHVLAPLLFARRTRAGHDTVVFPFFVDVERERLSLRVVSGLFWSLGFTKDDEAKTLSLAPGYVRYEDDEEVIEVAGALAWSRGKGESKAWSWHIQPLVSVWSHHDDHVRVHWLMGAFGYEREGQKRVVSVLGLASPTF